MSADIIYLVRGREDIARISVLYVRLVYCLAAWDDERARVAYRAAEYLPTVEAFTPK
jgi:hypothetical protein